MSFALQVICEFGTSPWVMGLAAALILALANHGLKVSAELRAEQRQQAIKHKEVRLEKRRQRAAKRAGRNHDSQQPANRNSE